MFCPDCGSVLMPRRDAGKPRFSLECDCGYAESMGEAIIIRERA